jgi:hypothetical protein
MTGISFEIKGVKQEIDPCEDIIVTDAAPDEHGVFVREFRFYGGAVIPNDAAVKGLVLTVRVKSRSKSKLEATAPPVAIDQYGGIE